MGQSAFDCSQLSIAIVWIQINDFKYYYLTLIILFNIKNL